MSHLMPPPRQKFFDSNGNVAAGFSLYSYQAGTATPLATYSDQTEGGTNANPIVLDSNGEAVIWLGANAYKFVLKDLSGVTVYTWDNIKSINLGTITLAMLLDGILTANVAGRLKMADGFVNTAKLLDGLLSADAAGRAKMAAGYLQSAHFAAGSVDTAAIAAAAVTRAKLAAIGQQISSSVGFSTANTSYTDVTGLAVTGFVSTGRLVRMVLVSDSTGAGSNINLSTTTTGTSVGGTLRFYDSTNSVELGDVKEGTYSAAATTLITKTIGPGVFMFEGVLSAGTRDIKVQVKCNSGTTFALNNVKLLVYEVA